MKINFQNKVILATFSVNLLWAQMYDKGFICCKLILCNRYYRTAYNSFYRRQLTKCWQIDYTKEQMYSQQNQQTYVSELIIWNMLMCLDVQGTARNSLYGNNTKRLSTILCIIFCARACWRNPFQGYTKSSFITLFC